MSQPLRVLFLTPYFRPYLGGVERAIEQLTFQIQQSEQVEAVAVLTTKYSFPRIPQPDWADREATPEGIGIYRLDGFPRKSIPLYSCPLVWFSPWQIRRYLREFDPNVVHFVSDGWFWGHFLDVVLVPPPGQVRVHPVLPRAAPEPVVAPFYQYLHLQRRGPRGRVDAAGSPLVQRDYKAPPSKQEIIGWGAPVPEFETVDSERSDDEASDQSGSGQPLTLLCVGRLGRHKGQEWLVDVYRRARPQFQRPVRLVLVGRDEGDQQRIADAVREAGLEDEVSMVGEVSDEELAQWYSRSDLFVLFSQYEAFGLVFFEAMAYGAPVLTHDVGANRELLTRGAAVVPRFDQDQAVSELVRLVNDDEYRRRLGRDAQEYTLAEFTWPAVAEKYLGVYTRGGEI